MAKNTTETATDSAKREFEFTQVFELKALWEHVAVSVTHKTNDFSKPVSISFIDRRTDAMVSVPPEVFGMIVEAVKAGWEQ